MFFASTAYAMGASGQAGGAGDPITAFAPLILMFGIFYFLLIRPQQKKAKEHRETLGNLKKGDYILTGGFYGRIVQVEGDVLTVELAPNMQVKVNRQFVSGLADPAASKKEAKKENKKEEK